MASIARTGDSLDDLLSVIPSLPRPALSRIVTRIIEHLDDVDGDPDLEPDPDFEPDDDLEDTHDAEPDDAFLEEYSDPEARAYHRRRIRRTRCAPVYRNRPRRWPGDTGKELAGWRLLREPDTRVKGITVRHRRHWRKHRH